MVNYNLSKYSILFKKIRKYKKLKQSEMAQLLNCTQGSISKIESSKMKPEVDLYLCFCSYFKIDPLTCILGEVDFHKTILKLHKGRVK